MLQQKNISEVNELIRDIRDDFTIKGRLTSHILETFSTWLKKLEDYPSTTLSYQDLKELTLYYDAWKKLLQ